jgi:hypothetical protein
MNEWNIQSRAHGCQSCEKHFADKQPYHTILLDLKHEIQRRDLCESCWKQEHGEGATERKGFISHWQGVYEAPPPAPPEPIQKENAETLLRKIMESNDARYAAASYILAAMLERKRILKVKEQIEREGQRIFIYEHSKTGDVFTIPDADRQLSDEAVQRDVAALLEHGLNPPVPAQGASASAAGPEEIPSMAPETETAPESEPVAR